MQDSGKTRTNSDIGPQKLLYEFGAFQVDPHARLLLRDGQPVPVTGKAFDILLVFLKSHGEVVTKDDLIAQVWPDTVVEEGNLGRNISRLRKALDESPEEHRYIVTLARSGYRFVADVHERWEKNGVAAGPARVKPFPAPDPSRTPAVGSRPRRWSLWSMAAFVALLVLLGSVIAGYRWTRGRARHALEAVQRQLTANPTDNWVIGAAISPDGRYLAFQDRTGLYLRAIDSGETHAVPLPPEWRDRYVTGLRWFPDGGKLIASVSAAEGYDIWAITVVGLATPRFIRRCGFWSAISPDGRRMAFQNGQFDRLRGKELWVSGIDGESPWKLLTAEDGEIALSPVWSPDGRWIAYLKGAVGGVTTGFARTAAIAIRPAGGGSARTLVPGSSLPESTSLFCMNGRGCLSWSPDGRLVFTATGPSETDLTRAKYSIWAVPVELRKGAAGEPVRLAQWADFYPDCLTLTADGKRLAFMKGRVQWDVYVSELGADGDSLKRTRRLTRDSRGFGSGPDAWTRDGRILFSSDRNGKQEVFSQGLNENLPQAVVRVPGDEQHDARLSPDGSWILYLDHAYSAIRAVSPPQRLMRVPVAGGSPELVLQVPASMRFDYRCPLKAGACVLSERQGNEVLFYPLEPLRGKGDRLLGKRVLPLGAPSWDVSPDGSRVALVDSSKRVLVLSDGSWHEVPLEERWGDPASIAWTADGTGFLITSANSLLHVTTAGKMQILTHNDFSQDLERPVPSPDGRYLAFQVQTYDFNAWMIENP